MLTSRSVLKWLHWLSAAMILYFFLIEPEDVERLGAAALATNAGVGIMLALVVGVWTIKSWTKGLAGRPGPKLPGWGKTFHRLNHRALVIGMPIMVMTGALAGFAAPYVIRAFGVLPIFEDLHEIAFNVLLFLILAHFALHIWRHIMLKDNALRIMVPKILHRHL